MKITFMGAGSTVFARNVLGDCMCTPALQNCEIALYDIDEKRLEDSRIILSAINQNVNEGRSVIKTYLGVEQRKDALRDATFVVNAIQVGGYEPCTVIDFEIPKKYGLQQTIGDTLESAELCGDCEPFRFWKNLQETWKKSARIPCF